MNQMKLNQVLGVHSTTSGGQRLTTHINLAVNLTTAQMKLLNHRSSRTSQYCPTISYLSSSVSSLNLCLTMQCPEQEVKDR